MLLEFSLEGLDLIEIIKSVCQQEPFKSSGKPNGVSVNQERLEDFPENSLELLEKTEIEDFSVEWGEYIPNTNIVRIDDSHAVILDLNKCVKVLITDHPPQTIQEVLDMIAPVPWTLASFGTTHYEWDTIEKQEEGTAYLGPSIGNLHFNLGWACAFKGEGHKHLASKRILDYGPWHVIRDEEHDITLVQFYDLDADAETALEQAKPGHFLMGDYAHGVLITDETPLYDEEFKAFYNPEARKLEVLVVERELPLTEIIDACKAKYGQAFGPNEPIDNAAFIFMLSEEEARKHLFDIWVRGLECWTFIDSLPARLDTDYTPPPPQKPEWVQRLQAQQTDAAD